MEELLKNFHNLSEEKQKLFKMLLKEKGIDLTSKFILPQNRNNKIFPLSFSQQRLWFLEKMEPNNSLYIIPTAVKITGKIRIELFVKSVNKIINRHEILRTRFIEKDGTGYQEILDTLEITHNFIDISQTLNQQEKLDEIISSEITKPINIAECPLFRIIFIKLSGTVHYMLMPIHHIIFDNWSTGLLVKEILHFYNLLVNGKSSDLEKLEIQFADYSVWQKDWLKGEELEKQKKYWINKLENSNDILEIIPQKKRLALQTYNGSHITFSIDAQLVQQLEKFIKKNDITIFVLFLSAFQILISKFSYQNDYNIGIPVANRNRTEIENLIGFFINTLVIRAQVNKENSLQEFLKFVKKNTFEAYSNQDIPFEMLIDELKLKRDLSHTALFQSMLVLNNAPLPKIEIEGLQIEPIDIDTGKTKFDLVLSLTKIENKYNCKFEFNTDLYDKEFIQNLIDNFIYLLKYIIDNPDQKIKNVELLEFYKKLNFMRLLSHKPVQTENKFIHSWFEETTEKYPNKIAISDGENIITYSELNILSNKIANYLIENQIKPEQCIGIFLDRRIEYIVSILGILKAGGCFVPLDVTYPKERLQYIFNDAQISVVITNTEFAESINFSEIKKVLIDNIKVLKEISTTPKIKLELNNSAYIIYTSGTSGLPKGVVVEHSKISYHIQQMIESFGINNSDKYFEFATFNFDASIEQIFVPLLVGAELFLRKNNYWLPSEFLKIINDEEISVINPPTVYWNQLVSEIKNYDNINCGKLRLVIVGGGEMKAELISEWKKKVSSNIDLINAYGPTESIITSTLFDTKNLKVDENKLHIPIGRSLGKRSVYIFDENDNLVPPGMPGELCFGGDLIARGYFNNQILTAKSFIPDKLSTIPGKRIYKTGDLVRYDQQGFIQYLGRIDSQVKFNGYRIELSEIEEVLLRYPDSKNAAVVIQKNDSLEILIAFISTNSSSDDNVKLISEYLKQRLPSFMVPNQIIIVDEFPLNSNGKIDKSKLIQSKIQIETKKEYVAPRSDLEKELVELLSNLLQQKKIGIFDDFFELGGHSILAIKFISEIKEKFGVDIQLKQLFEHPNIIGLSEIILSEQLNIIDEGELEDLLKEL